MTLVQVIPSDVVNNDDPDVLENWINDWVRHMKKTTYRDITIRDIKQINSDKGSAITLIVYDQIYLNGYLANCREFRIVKFQSPIDKTVERLSKAYGLISKLNDASIEDFSFIDDHQSRELDHIIISFSYKAINTVYEDEILEKIFKL